MREVCEKKMHVTAAPTLPDPIKNYPAQDVSSAQRAKPWSGIIYHTVYSSFLRRVEDNYYLYFCNCFFFFCNEHVLV